MDNLSIEINKKSRLEKLGVALFFFFIIVGILTGSIFANTTTSKLKSALQVKALTLASFIDPNDLLALNGDLSDIDNPKYKELKSRLIEAHSYDGEIRFIYILGRKPDGNLFYYTDSENSNSNNHSSPGQIYTASSPEEETFFEQGLNYVQGPHKDEFGEWVTAHAPIYNPKNGLAFARVSIDIPAHEYEDTWTSIFFSTFAVGFFVALIVLLFTIYLKNVIRLLRRGTSELAIAENQKRLIEQSSIKAGLGYFKWNRVTGDFILPNFLATNFELEPNTNFELFKAHIPQSEIDQFENAIIDACLTGNSSLVYELNYSLANGTTKRLRMNCDFAQIYQNNPKFVEGTILQL
jgi:hypothetical protein